MFSGNFFYNLPCNPKATMGGQRLGQGVGSQAANRIACTSRARLTTLVGCSAELERLQQLSQHRRLELLRRAGKLCLFHVFQRRNG